MSVDIILKDIEWDGVNKIRVPLEGGGTQDFSIGGGVTPTGNINITHSGQTDVTNYATATVPTADANAGAISSSYVTENNQRKWKFTYEGYAESSGWVDEGSFGSPQTYEYNAVPSNTTITPTTSQQTIGGQNYMMEGAVTVSAVQSMTLPATTSSTPTGTRRANLFPSTSQQYLNIPAGLNDTAKYYQIIGMDLAPLNVTQNGTYNAADVDITGFNTVTVNVSGGTPSLQTKSKTYTPTTSQQTESITADSGYDGLDTVNVTVNAMPTGTAGTPTATKGTVSNHSVSVTPSVTNTTGYITGGTKTGNSVTVTANELASGNLPITANADNINVVGYASVSVNVPSASPNLQTKTRTYTPAITQQQEVISADSGYDGLLAVGITVDPMPTLTLPSVASMSSTGTRKAKIYQSNYTQYYNIGTGYHSVNEYYEIPPLLVDTKTITANGTYNAIDDDLDGYSSVVVNVSGTSKNVQTAQSTTRSTSSSYTKVITLTCSKAGTYDVYWSTFRSSTSGTWGSQLYLNNTAYGTAQTGSWSYHIQNIHLSNVSISANAEVAVRVRSRGNNYYGYVGTLTIIEN